MKLKSWHLALVGGLIINLYFLLCLINQSVDCQKGNCEGADVFSLFVFIIIDFFLATLIIFMSIGKDADRKIVGSLWTKMALLMFWWVPLFFFPYGLFFIVLIPLIGRRIYIINPIRQKLGATLSVISGLSVVSFLFLILPAAYAEDKKIFLMLLIPVVGSIFLVFAGISYFINENKARNKQKIEAVKK